MKKIQSISNIITNSSSETFIMSYPIDFPGNESMCEGPLTVEDVANRSHWILDEIFEALDHENPIDYSILKTTTEKERKELVETDMKLYPEIYDKIIGRYIGSVSDHDSEFEDERDDAKCASLLSLGRL